MKVDRKQFEQLVLPELDCVYRVARRLVRDPAAAEDLTQETFLRAWKAAENFDLQSFGVRPWLLRILHNLHINRIAQDQRQRKTLEENWNLGVAATPMERLPIDAASSDAMDQRLVAALASAPPEYAAVLQMWAVEEMSYKEIAAALDIPLGTVMSRLHRARENLSGRLSDLAAERNVPRDRTEAME
jgi:RNA polymerase sigma-70 factor, ECF subfamily